MMGSMAAKDTSQAIEFALSKKELVRIWEEFNIPKLIRLELLSHSERVTTGSMT